MKSRNITYFENRINQLRSELHQLIDQEPLDSSMVQKLSQELDTMINLYCKYRKESDSAAC